MAQSEPPLIRVGIRIFAPRGVRPPLRCGLDLHRGAEGITPLRFANDESAVGGLSDDPELDLPMPVLRPLPCFYTPARPPRLAALPDRLPLLRPGALRFHGVLRPLEDGVLRLLEAVAILEVHVLDLVQRRLRHAHVDR